MEHFTPTEQSVSGTFISDGYVIVPANDRAALDRIRCRVVASTLEFIGLSEVPEDGAFLDSIAERLTLERLNDLRLAIIAKLGADRSFRKDYFECGRSTLETIVGNELAMQRGTGFSIQLPNDHSSLLPLHSDAWSEDSPYEVVLWIPLVDCMRTKSMFIAPPDVDARWRTRIHEFESAEALFGQMEPELRFLEIPYGHVLIFTHTLMHGNRVNRERTTRWSLNIRFKGLFTPYSDKRLGDFFEPITVRAATRIGLDYRLPDGFHE